VSALRRAPPRNAPRRTPRRIAWGPYSRGPFDFAQGRRSISPARKLTSEISLALPQAFGLREPCPLGKFKPREQGPQSILRTVRTCDGDRISVPGTEESGESSPRYQHPKIHYFLPQKTRCECFVRNLVPVEILTTCPIQ